MDVVLGFVRKVKERRFSAALPAPKCGHSISELEPRLFSSNNPAAALPDFCDGFLGVKQFFSILQRWAVLVNGETDACRSAIFAEPWCVVANHRTS